MTNKNIEEMFMNVGILNSSESEYHSPNGFYKKGVKLLERKLFGPSQIFLNYLHPYVTTTMSFDNLAKILCDISACKSVEESKKFIKSVSDFRSVYDSFSATIPSNLSDDSEGFYFNKVMNNKKELLCKITRVHF